MLRLFEAAWLQGRRAPAERFLAWVRVAMAAAWLGLATVRPTAWALTVGACAGLYALAWAVWVNRHYDTAQAWIGGSAVVDTCAVVVPLLLMPAARPWVLPLVEAVAAVVPWRWPPPPLVWALEAALTGASGIAGGGWWAAATAVVAATMGEWSRQARLEARRTLRDALTGAYTREYAVFCLDRLLGGQQWPFCVIWTDLDGFKMINDTFGHPRGDRVLREWVGLAVAVAGQRGLVARLGGDEFLLVLEKTTREEALALAQRLREATEQYGRERYGSALSRPFTVSCGVAEGGPGLSTEALLQTADVELYRLKRSQRRP